MVEINKTMEKELFIDKLTGRLWRNPIWDNGIPAFMPNDVSEKNLVEVECEEIYSGPCYVEHDLGLRVFKNPEDNLAVLVPWDITPSSANFCPGGIWYSGKGGFFLKNVIVHWNDAILYLIEQNQSGKWGVCKLSETNDYSRNPFVAFEFVVDFDNESASAALAKLNLDLDNFSFVNAREPEKKDVIFEIIDCTPEHISSLAPNEIFVFGSNIHGMHGGGAAAFAMSHFGAVWGKGEGITGQCYALPTMEGGVDYIQEKVKEFLGYARQHPEKKFLVTPIACGIAGFKAEEIAPLFSDALTMKNVTLPRSFLSILIHA